MRTGRLGAVLTIVTLVGVGCGSTTAGSGDQEAAASGDVTATTVSVAVPDADAAIAAVVTAIDAKNALDLDAWLAAFAGNRRTRIPLEAEQILMNAGQHWEIVEPCQLVSTVESGDSVVECVISNTDNYWGAGAIFDTKPLRFTVDTDGLLSSADSFSSDRRIAFNQAFHQWLSEAHPDVYAGMDIGHISPHAPGFEAGNPDHMLTAVDYVEEFVAQSDEYPLAPSDS